MKKRRILYYLPFIQTKESIEFSNFKIKPFSKDADYSDLLPEEIFDCHGSLIETKKFFSGQHYSIEEDVNIFNAIEKVKFAYFFLNPAHSFSVFGYVSSETFECFRIIEKNSDPSFEHKVNFSNGMFNFSESLATYYKSRTVHNQNNICIDSKILAYVDCLSEVETEENLLIAMRLYNRCWSTYSLHNSIDKPMLARVSIEILAKFKLGKTNGLKEFVDHFLSQSHKKLKELSKSSSSIRQILNSNIPTEEELKNIITKHLDDIKEARHAYTHAGVEDEAFNTIPFYLLWFPLFWMVILRIDIIKEAEGIRLALFFCLLKFPYQDWQKMDFFGLPHKTKKSHLHIYSDNSRLLPVYLKLERDSKELSEAMLKGIYKWLNPELT